MDASFSFRNKTRGRRPRLPFEDAKNAVLGKSYDLSVVLLQPHEARALTRRTKGKDKPSNVLSFPLSKHSGEIFLCPWAARAQASEYDRSPRDFLMLLFIHGMLHLKGMRHGSTMTRQENRFLKKFDLRR